MSTEQVTEVDAAAQVEALARELSRRGFAATVTTSGTQRHPSVRVANKKVTRMWEDIYAAPTDCEWFFWWSWADRIGPMGDIAATAAAIAYVLNP
jgi:hypothetical protein